MHFEILVEDQSGKKALDILIPKLITNAHTFKVHDTRELVVSPRTSAVIPMQLIEFS